MHQIHVQEFIWDVYRPGRIGGCLDIFYTRSRDTGVIEEYIIAISDPCLKGWAPSEIDANMLATFIPSCVTLCNRVRKDQNES